MLLLPPVKKILTFCIKLNQFTKEINNMLMGARLRSELLLKPISYRQIYKIIWIRTYNLNSFTSKKLIIEITLNVPLLQIK